MENEEKILEARLTEILDKLLPHQKKTGNGPVDFGVLASQGVITSGDLEFVQRHGVHFNTERRTLEMSVESLPTNSSGTLMVGRSDPKPRRRSAPCRSIPGIVDSLLSDQVRLSRESFSKMPICIHLGREHETLIVSPGMIAIEVPKPGERDALPAIRDLLKRIGFWDAQEDPHFRAAMKLAPVPPTDRSLHFLPPGWPGPTPGQTVGPLGRVVQEILAELGFTPDSPIEFSAKTMDEAEPGYEPASGKVRIMRAISSVHSMAQPDLPLKDLGIETDPMIVSFITEAIQEPFLDRNPDEVHGSAAEILASAGAVARRLFGDDAATVLRAAGIDSSAAFGKVLYQLIEKGVFAADANDDPNDFNVHSAFDDLFK